jgi:DNA-binding MarR family transcriptional regulator
MADVKLPEGFRLRPESMLCFDIYATHHAVGQVYQPLLSNLGLTYPQYLVMILLWERDGQTVGQLGERLDLASSTLTPLIKRLETQGLVTRKRDTADERKVRVHLSQSGRSLQHEASHVPGCVAEAFGLSMEQFAQIHSLLGQLRNALKSRSDSEAA